MFSDTVSYAESFSTFQTRKKTNKIARLYLYLQFSGSMCIRNTQVDREFQSLFGIC